jgi:hypothetical protein
MDTRQTRDLPAGLEKVRRRFECWRRTRKPRSRIPNSLWVSAVKMARAYGMCRTARALRVGYYSLKKRVEEEAVVAPFGPEENAVPTFLELAPPLRTGFGQCTLELEDAGGAKMRVQLNGFESLDLAALTRNFWNPGP